MDDAQAIAARLEAYTWINSNCDGNNNVGICPKCGERVQVKGNAITDDGRLIASCGDAFNPSEWDEKRISVRLLIP